MKISEILRITNGKLVWGYLDDLVENFTINSNEISENTLFFGINKGNYYYEDAIKKGAKAVIIDKKDAINNLEQNIILVDDTIEAMQRLAKYKALISGVSIIGITGSTGKTSTKDIVYEILKRDYNVLKTKENFNGQIGVPLTILSLKDEQILVLEMGTDDIGELNKLVSLVTLDIAVITNIGTSHIGKFGSKENILKAKLEIINGIKKGGVLLLNNDDNMLSNYQNNNLNIIKYGKENDCFYKAKNIVKNDKIQFEVNGNILTIPNYGESFIYNALVGYIVGRYYNVSINNIKHALSNFKLSQDRMNINKINGITFINDFYNANYDSMKNALEVLGNYNGRKIAVLGSMLELGDYSNFIHRLVGIEVIKNKIDYLITVGEEAKNISKNLENKICVKNFDTIEEAYNFLIDLVEVNDNILLKASHGMDFKTLSNNLNSYYKKCKIKKI